MLKPQQFGRYILVDRISTGGMAEVFLAKASGVQGFEKILAIKRILPSISEDSDFTTMFIDEAKISANLAHVNIGQVFEFGQVSGQYYIAMEYIPGKDLRAIQTHLDETGRLMDLPMALHVVGRLCMALDYAHRQKNSDGTSMEIVHRDVSPPNVIVSYDGAVKLIDFGIAKAASRGTRTRAGKLKGKFAYMSPEQVQGLPVDRRSDVFNLGILLHELLTNRRLFHGENQLNTLNLVRKAEVPPPSSINPDVPVEVDRIVLKALARDREQRYGWATELRADIERHLARTSSVYEPNHLADWMRAEFAGEIEAERRMRERMHGMQSADAEPARPHTPPPAISNGGELTRDELPTRRPADARGAPEPSTDVYSRDSLEAEPDHRAKLAEVPTSFERPSRQNGPTPTPPTADGYPAYAEEEDEPTRDAPEEDDEPTRDARDEDNEPTRAALKDDLDEPTRAASALASQLAREMRSAAEEEPLDVPDTSPRVIGPADQKQRVELVNAATMLRTPDSLEEPAHAGGIGALPSLHPDESEDSAVDQALDEALQRAEEDALAAADAVAAEALPPDDAGDLMTSDDDVPLRGQSSGAIASLSRDAATIGGALEIDSSPRRASPSVDPSLPVDVRGLGVEQYPGPWRPPAETPSGTRHVPAAPRFSSAQIVVLAASITLFLAGVVVLLVLLAGRDTPDAGTAAQPMGSVVVTSSPPAACSVSVGSVPKGILQPGASLTLSMEVGRHLVSVECAGFQGFAAAVDVNPGQVSFVVADLQKK